MSNHSVIHIIAERRIKEAIIECRLNTLTGRSKPLSDDNTHFIPKYMRMAYKMLQNSGYLPPVFETRMEIHRQAEFIVENEDEYTRIKQLQKLNVLKMKRDTLHNRPSTFGW